MLTVADIMQRDVVTVGPDTSVRDVTRLLADEGISGVPVVGAGGLVLGVISSTDLIRHAAASTERGYAGIRWTPRSGTAWSAETGYESDDESEVEVLGSYFLPEDSPFPDSGWEVGFDDASEDELTAQDLMTPASFSIPASATVVELAEFLIRGRIHRAVVTDGGHLQGIVTTMDVLTVVANGEL